MLSLRPATRAELPIFDTLDRQQHARRFVLQTGLQQHEKLFGDPNITYLSIANDAGEFCGYFILVVEPDSNSVEFRRIIIDRDKRGIGQQAIHAMENFCRLQLNVKRIWLDVYDDNATGIHIYKKIGYRQFKQEPRGSRQLLFFEKSLERCVPGKQEG